MKRSIKEDENEKKQSEREEGNQESTIIEIKRRKYLKKHP